MNDEVLERVFEEVIVMRSATDEERKAVNDYIKSISKPTGRTFWDYLNLMKRLECTDNTLLTHNV